MTKDRRSAAAAERKIRASRSSSRRSVVCYRLQMGSTAMLVDPCHCNSPVMVYCIDDVPIAYLQGCMPRSDGLELICTCCNCQQAPVLQYNCSLWCFEADL